MKFRDYKIAISRLSESQQRWWQTVGRLGFNERFVAEVDLYAKGQTAHGREYLEALQFWVGEGEAGRSA